ncbi:MAG: DUF2892 domain-containing protein [Ignavibacteriales bacterium]|nr:DUF2892 domain-containing protein [Ignavibacteriales bacterium]
MKHNMGSADRILRSAIALTIGGLYFADSISGTTAIILGLLAVIFLFTGSVGFCPLYAPFKFSTKKVQKSV